jgi:hypothetical protein
MLKNDQSLQVFLREEEHELSLSAAIQSLQDQKAVAKRATPQRKKLSDGWQVTYQDPEGGTNLWVQRKIAGVVYGCTAGLKREQDLATNMKFCLSLRSK